MNKIESYIININEMEDIVQTLAQTQVKPTMNKDKYDYEEEQKTIELAVFLKIVRLIKFLYGNIHLLKDGHIMESCIICRAIDEDCEDISFIYLMFAEPCNENMSNKQKQFLKLKERLIDYFYNRNSVQIKRTEIRNAINELQETIGLAKSEASKKLYGFYSTSTHSKCEAIANSIYNVNQEKYDMRGKGLLTQDMIENLSNHIFRVMLSLIEACEIFKNNNLRQKAIHLVENFDELNPDLVVSPCANTS